MLLKKLTAAPKSAMPRGLELQDIIYNSAPEMRSLAFKSGYALGTEVYRSANNGGIATLEHVLVHAGFGKVIYHPFELMSTFTSYAPRSGGQNLGLNVHVFETGLIAGYLSAHTGQRIGVQETACVFNGANHCMFVAKVGSTVNAEAYKRLGLQEVILALRHALLHAERRKANESYYILSIKPLLNEPVLSEATKFLYVVGKMLVSQFPSEPAKTIEQSSSLLNISSSRLKSNRKKGVSLSLSYDHETSSGSFVDLSTALISGLMKGAYGKNVRIKRGISSKGVYNVKLEVL
ncbi:MAG: 4-vinyl reductase [Candidatus Micrarchaeota archaeon]|nr:4-vinyl reductase [Candidatus Micrarchaeota archaeon]